MISVIVPMYNCQGTLQPLLQSIQCQTFTDYEVILVDDGSTDGTGQLAADWCRTHSRFRTTRQENQGAPAARNRGIELARGDWLYFCDADDQLLPQTLQLLSAAAGEQHADLVAANYCNMDAEGKLLGEGKNSTFGRKLLGDDWFFTLDPLPGTKLFRAAPVREHGLRFAAVKIGQDLNFYLKYLLVAKKPAYIADTVYLYRRLEGSISKTYKVANILDIRRSLADVQAFAAQTGAAPHLVNSLEYVKLSHYMFQLRKRRHFSAPDFQLLRSTLCGEISLRKHFSLRRSICWAKSILDSLCINDLNFTLRHI